MARYTLRGRRPAVTFMRTVAAPKPAPVPIPEPEPEPVVEPPSLFRLTKAELIDLADERGIDASGSRSDLIGRLTKHADG